MSFKTWLLVIIPILGGLCEWTQDALWSLWWYHLLFFGTSAKPWLCQEHVRGSARGACC